MTKIDAFKVPEKQRYIGKRRSGSKSRKKTTMKLKHINLEAILEPFWPHLGVLGRALEAILGVFGQLEPT